MLKQCIANHPLKGREGPFILPALSFSGIFVCRGIPSGEKEKPAILCLIGRLSSANKDICFSREGLTD